jgi:hypothetical protein
VRARGHHPGTVERRADLLVGALPSGGVGGANYVNYVVNKNFKYSTLHKPRWSAR